MISLNASLLIKTFVERSARTPLATRQICASPDLASSTESKGHYKSNLEEKGI